MLVNLSTNLSTDWAGFTQVPLNLLDGDLKRMLRVQFKEFVHHIEDHECATKIAPLKWDCGNDSFGKQSSVA